MAFLDMHGFGPCQTIMKPSSGGGRGVKGIEFQVLRLYVYLAQEQLESLLPVP